MTTAVAGAWWKSDPAGEKILLTLHVQSNARHTMVAGRYGDALKLKIAAPALDDKAKWALIDFPHQWFKLPLSRRSESGKAAAGGAKSLSSPAATPKQ